MTPAAPRPARSRALACATALAIVASPALGAQAVPATSGDTMRLALSEAVAIALRESDEALLAVAQSELADAQVTVARAAGLPQLRLNTSYNRAYESARANAVGQLFNQPETYATTLNLSQTVFQGGRLRAAARAATSLRAATRHDTEEARAAIALLVQRAYLAALLADRVAAIQRQNVDLAAERVVQIEQLLAAGRAARYDLLRARVERSNLEPLLIQAENDRTLAVLEVRRLLNLPVDRPVVLTTTIEAADATALAAQVAATAAAAAPEERATVRAAEETLRSRREGVKIARADRLPTVGFTFNTGFQAFPPRGSGLPLRRGALSPANCTNPNATNPCQNGGWFQDRAAGLTLSLPVFDGFRTRGNIDLAQAQQRLAELDLRQTRELVTIEVARARAELARAESDFAARAQTTAEADEAFRLARLRFNRGLSTQLEVSDAQLALRTAQTGEARATVDLYLAAVELARAVGRPVVPTP